MITRNTKNKNRMTQFDIFLYMKTKTKDFEKCNVNRIYTTSVYLIIFFNIAYFFRVSMDDNNI
ncbi:hypothetical protein DERP_015056 [Dermatophagoides pteronyssinus]|uniref:Uncharacterized protein n=1 Tax=Dermatophagoides pteronyssinus TaxID=6956 RepID=A0ABQ8J5W4_DERPT|nr:hypothetical protein DERP_015056 [Dermatophagoides pteronyssinus]